MNEADKNPQEIPNVGETADGVKAISENELFDLADFFKMFADSSRISVLFSLFHKSLCVSDIAEALSMSESAVCHHLKALKQSNLVYSRRDGKRVIYSLSDSHVVDILECGLEHIRE